jgi:hypothetical protein
MTEAEWLACDDPRPMLDYLRSIGRASDRRLRLFAVACCRHVCLRAHDGRLLSAVDAAERTAGSTPSRREMAAVRRSARAVADEPTQIDDVVDIGSAIRAIERLASPGPDVLLIARYAAYAMLRTPPHAMPRSPAGPASVAAEEFRRQAGFVRDIFGPPHRPMSFDRGWLSPNVVSLATAIDAERGYDAMPVLGDALEEAACDDAEVLDHCRSASGHVRGCYVLDLILMRA